jgi:hypothetical protein
MKTSLLFAFVTVLLAGCAAGSNFKPVTAEGASCKAECARDMASCRGSSYTCDRAASTCMSACADLDAIKSKQGK